jgi:hypothetical protein
MNGTLAEEWHGTRPAPFGEYIVRPGPHPSATSVLERRPPPLLPNGLADRMQWYRLLDGGRAVSYTCKQTCVSYGLVRLPQNTVLGQLCFDSAGVSPTALLAVPVTGMVILFWLFSHVQDQAQRVPCRQARQAPVQEPARGWRHVFPDASARLFRLLNPASVGQVPQ